MSIDLNNDGRIDRRELATWLVFAIPMQLLKQNCPQQLDRINSVDIHGRETLQDGVTPADVRTVAMPRSASQHTAHAPLPHSTLAMSATIVSRCNGSMFVSSHITQFARSIMAAAMTMKPSEDDPVPRQPWFGQPERLVDIAESISRDQFINFVVNSDVFELQLFYKHAPAQANLKDK